MKISIIVSVFNEKLNIALLHNRLLEVLQKNYEIIFINDGSSDGSYEEIEKLCQINNKIIGVHFSRNFGHEAAMNAGLDYANGDVLIFMDCDLQHPPDLIPKLIETYLEGYDIVKPKRVYNQKTPLYKKISSPIFYRLLNFISKNKVEEGVSDYFLISKKVGDILKCNYPERVRFFRVLIQTIGFKQVNVSYVSQDREHGKSKYSFIKLLTLSFSALALNSKSPLRLGVILSLFISLFALLVVFYTIVMKFYAQPVSGYTTVVILISFLFSFLFLFLGIIAEYIGIIFDETKQRPKYIVDKLTKHEA